MKKKEFDDELVNLLGDRCSFYNSININYAKGEDIYDPIMPKAVVFPNTNEEISKIIKLCNLHNVPIVPYGAGSSLEGNVLAIKGGITLSLEKMNKILELNLYDYDIRVQSGLKRLALNSFLKDKGMFFPIDPGANATIGGMSSTSAGGTMSLMYGTMKSVVMGLTVILPSGEIIKTGTRAKKNVAGYNLTNLFVGSEGTLGIISEIQLKVFNIPKSITVFKCQFIDLDSAINTAQKIMSNRIPIAKIELLNTDQINASIRYSKLKNFDSLPTLMCELHENNKNDKQHLKNIEEIIYKNNGINFEYATDPEEINMLWKARAEVYHNAKSLKPNGRVYTSDMCLPLSNLAECIRFAEETSKKLNIFAPIVSHLGDGNFHTNIAYDPNDREIFAKIKNYIDNLADKAISLGGTISGEHGIGLNKKTQFLKQHPDNINLIKLIKKSFDINNICNPGKIIDLN